jgi:class 3 adenylate cyclase
LSAFRVIQILNIIFASFDELCVIYNVTKVKTIGDCIIIVSNLETYQPDHAQRLAHLGLHMIRKVIQFNNINALGVQLAVRIGISTGNLFGMFYL